MAAHAKKNSDEAICSRYQRALSRFWDFEHAYVTEFDRAALLAMLWMAQYNAG